MEGAHLGEVPDSVFGFRETHVGSLARPEVRFGVGLREHARRADEVPRRERKARLAMILLRRNVCTRGGGDVRVGARKPKRRMNGL